MIDSGLTNEGISLIDNSQANPKVFSDSRLRSLSEIPSIFRQSSHLSISPSLGFWRWVMPGRDEIEDEIDGSALRYRSIRSIVNLSWTKEQLSDWQNESWHRMGCESIRKKGWPSTHESPILWVQPRVKELPTFPFLLDSWDLTARSEIENEVDRRLILVERKMNIVLEESCTCRSFRYEIGRLTGRFFSGTIWILNFSEEDKLVPRRRWVGREQILDSLSTRLIFNQDSMQWVFFVNLFLDIPLIFYKHWIFVDELYLYSPLHYKNER
jgi:hypothetical protein